MKRSLYIHIPFCRKKCPYCDFYSVVLDRDIAAQFIDIICRQIKQLQGEFSTVYIGGGTPTVLPQRLLEKLFRSLTAVITKDAEFTIEANPESFNQAKAELFLRQGINRVSLGVQSFFNRKLKSLGRIHSGQQAEQAVRLAKACGFKNISIDLIFGVEGESFIDWKKELETAVSLPVKHISAYALTCEKNTPFFKAVQQGETKLLCDSITSRMYNYTLNFLAKKGFEHYEVSNFSKKGYTCQHNLQYWDNNEYIGLGPSAVSYEQGERKRNISSVKDYITRVQHKVSVVVFREKLTLQQRAKETAALKIRTAQGIDFIDFKVRTRVDFMRLEAQAVERFIDLGILNYRTKKGLKTGVFLTQKGFLFCDEVCSEFL